MVMGVAYKYLDGYLYMAVVFAKRGCVIDSGLVDNGLCDFDFDCHSDSN